MGRDYRNMKRCWNMAYFKQNYVCIKSSSHFIGLAIKLKAEEMGIPHFYGGHCTTNGDLQGMHYNHLLHGARAPEYKLEIHATGRAVMELCRWALKTFNERSREYVFLQYRPDPKKTEEIHKKQETKAAKTLQGTTEKGTDTLNL